MANKATKALRLQIRKASKAGELEVQHLQPVFNYHSCGDNDDFRAHPSSFFTKVQFPTAVVGKGGTVSANQRRNMAMRVFSNKGEDGRKDTVTCHEPLVKGAFITFKNHDYLKGGYAQPKSVQTQSRPAISG